MESHFINVIKPFFEGRKLNVALLGHTLEITLTKTSMTRTRRSAVSLYFSLEK